jgi:hypothetical protein
MVFYSLGMRLSLGLGRPAPSPDHLLFGKCFSFFGLLAFWVESLFLGLGDLFPSSHILLRLESGYLSVKLVPVFGFSFG